MIAFGLGVVNRLDRAEEAEMHRRHRGDDGDIRPDQLGQGFQLAGVVHTGLEHAEIRVLPHVGERQRHAPMIVMGLERDMHEARGHQRNLQRLLGSGLADAAGHRDHHGVLGAGARSSAEIVQGLKRVGNAEQPLLAARGLEVLLDDGA